jgi:hypothetical protein
LPRRYLAYLASWWRSDRWEGPASNVILSEEAPSGADESKDLLNRRNDGVSCAFPEEILL